MEAVCACRRPPVESKENVALRRSPPLARAARGHHTPLSLLRGAFFRSSRISSPLPTPKKTPTMLTSATSRAPVLPARATARRAGGRARAVAVRADASKKVRVFLRSCVCVACVGEGHVALRACPSPVPAVREPAPQRRGGHDPGLAPGWVGTVAEGREPVRSLRALARAANFFFARFRSPTFPLPSDPRPSPSHPTLHSRPPPPTWPWPPPWPPP
jgi:hypothetical protein